MSSAKIYALAIDIAILGIAMAISIALFVQHASAIEVTVDPVSYTHLTLPTILLV